MLWTVALEKEMATHSSVLAWRIPGTAAPGGLPSMGSHRVGQDWSDLAAAAAGCHSLSSSEQASFNFMAAVTICRDFGAQKIKSLTISLSICHEVMEPHAMILVFWMLSFSPAFSLYSFLLIKRLFSSSSFFVIRMVSYAYLTLIFLPTILILAYDSYSLAFLKMYSAYKLNKQGDYAALMYSFPDLEPVHFYF